MCENATYYSQILQILKAPVYTKGGLFEAHIGKVPVHDFQQARGIISWLHNLIVQSRSEVAR
jgi:hypothetical protein